MHGSIPVSQSAGTQQTYNAGYVRLISAVAALGGLLFGYDFVVIGGAKPFYEAYFRLTSQASIGWANSCALLGCLLGSLLSGAVSDRFGRKKLLIVSALLFAVSSVFTGWANTFGAFVFWRITGGTAIGIASNVSPTYIAEVSPAPWRGHLVSLNQLMIVVGILAAQIVNWRIAQPMPAKANAHFIRQSWNGQFGWRWMFAAVALPSLIFLVSACFVPESPRWLVKNNLHHAAKRILARIGGSAYSSVAIQEIQKTLGAEVHSRVPLSELFKPRIRKIVALGIGLAVLQQWSGINIIFNYAEEVFSSAGYAVNDLLFNIVVTGSINLVFTLIALGLVDRFGRRALMLSGCAGIAISHALLGVSYFLHVQGWPVLLLTLAAIALYAMSLAPVTWVLISEIFPNRIRGLAVSVAVSALWIACFVLTFSFPWLNTSLGTAGAFWLYALVCFLGFVLLLYIPETKGKSLEELERQLVG